MLTDVPVVTKGQTGRVWIHSDLQLSKPEVAREIMRNAVDDMLALDLGIGAAWCLGDALVGSNHEALKEVASVSIEELARLNLPICYVLGNHEIDLKRSGTHAFPLYDRVVSLPNWHTMTSIGDLYFARMFYGTLVVFMGDHVDPDGRWYTSHGNVGGEADLYPHTADVYRKLRDAIAAHPGPVVTVSHYSYPGGQRPSRLMGQLLPLPENVGFHGYGHAHIGDLVHNKERPWQRENPIEGQTRVQHNISALENNRTPGSHSAVLEFGPEGPTRLRVRCHLERRWTETFDLQPVTIGA